MANPAVIARYKVAFWRDGDSIQSIMYDDLGEANQASEIFQKSGYLVTTMELDNVDGNRYRWKLLKGGVSPFFGLMTKAYRHRLLWGAMALGMYLVRRR